MSEQFKINNRVKYILYNLTGITLTDNKDIMIINRLEKLLRNTNFKNDINALLDKVEYENEYTANFINIFTTNKTHFFREEFHFIDLKNRVLKHYNNESYNVYCCAASTGEEPYSIAMTFKEVSKNTNVKIIATDINTEVLQYAANGIYRFQKSSQEFPSWIKPQKYFKKKIVGDIANGEVLIKVNDDLMRLIIFGQMNLKDENYPFANSQFDIIFCRNVLIYFSFSDQNIILKKLFKHLKLGGTIYIGHSESIQDLNSHVDTIGQNIFIKKSDF
jgi:chemotaxis protein methyltransferase CheR